MAKLRHIAITVPDPWKAAEFYMQAFGLKKVGETDWENARGGYLSDGVINVAWAPTGWARRWMAPASMK